MMLPFSETAETEFAGDQRQRHAGHEDDKALEEFAGSGEPPDQPLHAGHRRRREVGAIGPDRQFVDVVLDGAAGGLRGGGWCRFKRRVGHLECVLCEGLGRTIAPANDTHMNVDAPVPAARCRAGESRMKRAAGGKLAARLFGFT